MPYIRRVRTITDGVAGSPYYTNHYFTAETDAGDAQSAVSAFWSQISPVSAEAVNFNVESIQLVLDVATGEVQNGEVGGGATIESQFSFQLLPPGTQGMVSWKTTTYRRGRLVTGRTFVPGLPEERNVNGHPDATMVTALQTAGNALLNFADAELVIYSRPVFDLSEIGGPIVRPGAISPVAQAVALTEWSSLRTRRAQG